MVCQKRFGPNMGKCIEQIMFDFFLKTLNRTYVKKIHMIETKLLFGNNMVENVMWWTFWF